MADAPHSDEDTMRDEYDFGSMKGLVRGKHYEAARRAMRLVRLPSDLQSRFPDDESVEAALRIYAAEHPEQSTPAG